MIDDELGSLPRMILFRWTKPGLAPFLAQHLDAQVRTLGHFFEVRIVDYDCDYAQVCEHFNPEICVFESGVYSGERRIKNTNSRPEIPKLGFLHADAYDAARAVFISDMAGWGVEDFFTTSVAMAEYSPEIAERLFVWPNAIDPSTFRDYGIEKNIPVLFTGSQERHYPWRNSVNRILSQRYSTMTMPHFGWGGGTSRMIFGEEYAKLLNASFFVPACGSMARDVVRKQLEIPAAMSCLVTERTPNLEAFGFVDMVNCVFAEGKNVLEKLDDLWHDKEQLGRITRAGHQLVHSSHTESNRSQVLEWLELSSKRQPGQRVVQKSPCGSLTLASADSRSPIRVGPGIDRTNITSGWRLLRTQRLEAAEREFLKCLNYYFIPEAVTGLVFVNLAKGDAAAALEWATQALSDAFDERGSSDPDPVLWACRIRALICAGQIGAAASSARRFLHLAHPELDRIRAALAEILPEHTKAPFSVPAGNGRSSIAPVPPLDLTEWREELSFMLTRCGQEYYGQRLYRLSSPHGAMPNDRHAHPSASSLAALQGLPKRVKRALKRRLKSGFILRVRMALSPYKQRLVSDDLSRLITDIVRREELTQAIFIGKAGRRVTRALEAGLRMNPSLPRRHNVLSCSDAEAQGLFFRGNNERAVVLVGLPTSEAKVGVSTYAAQLASCSLVVIDGTTTPLGVLILSSLQNARFSLLAHDPESGRAILRQLESISDATFPVEVYR
jgi:hypothetical protein